MMVLFDLIGADGDDAGKVAINPAHVVKVEAHRDGTCCYLFLSYQRSVPRVDGTLREVVGRLNNGGPA